MSEQDPENDLPAIDAEVKAMHLAAASRIPMLADYPVAATAICYYTVAPEERFIAHQDGPTWILTGFSGHGFKFGPLIGQRLAGVVDGRIAAADFARWISGHTDLMEST